MNKTKILHIAIIIAGIIFVSISAFHANIWFDESYSVAMVNTHNFSEIWQIGGHDVHPVFYYWMLKVISIIFGANIIVYRFFSVLALAILGIIGYTHIRKDFGEKTGLVFSFVTFFLPLSVIYAGEIRMYTWGMLFVTLMCIYAYRIYKNAEGYKNWIIFSIFSLISAYTHYYGLMAAGIVNLMLMVFFIIQAVKEKKWSINLTKYIIQGVVQIALYLPWILSLLFQMKQVSAGFWINIKFPETLIDIFIFQFTGALDSSIINTSWALIYSVSVILCIGYLNGKFNISIEDKKLLKMGLAVYSFVFLGACMVSIVMKRPIIYARYLILVTGAMFFVFSLFLAKYSTKKIGIFLISITLMFSIYTNYNMLTANYSKSNNEPIEFIRQNVMQSDLIVFNNEASGFIVTTKFPELKTYFYDSDGWHVEEAYKAFGDNMKTVYDINFLNDYNGRIWFITSNNNNIINEAKEKYSNIKLLEEKTFETKYHGYKYTFTLVQKGE